MSLTGNSRQHLKRVRFFVECRVIRQQVFLPGPQQHNQCAGQFLEAEGAVRHSLLRCDARGREMPRNEGIRGAVCQHAHDLDARISFPHGSANVGDGRARNPISRAGRAGPLPSGLRRGSTAPADRQQGGCIWPRQIGRAHV